MNKFISYPVGQGFFYSGTIGDFQLVYDCGLDSKNSNIEDLIDYYELDMNSSGVINMLVISHFDYDHISGLLYLLKKFTVEKMYISYNNNPKVLYLIDLLEKISGSSIDRIILVPLNDENRNDEISEDGEELSYDGEFYEIPDDIKSKIFKGKNSIKKSSIQWEFYFFNVPLSKSSELNSWISILEKRINKEMKSNGVTKISELIQIIGITKIKEIYEKSLKACFVKKKKNMDLTKGDWSNNSSLCLYHKPRYESRIFSFDFYDRICRYAFWLDGIYHNDNSGTLLTGDIDLSGNRLTAFRNWLRQNQLEDSIGVIYLPHHGAIKNWDKYLLDIASDNNSISVSSAGKNNKYGHPSPRIMKNYKRNGLIHIICDEDHHFEYCIEDL